MAAGWFRRPACGSRTRGRRSPCAARKMLTIIAIFPIPDLLPLDRHGPWIAAHARADARTACPAPNRYMTDYGLSAADARVLTGSRELADYFEACLTQFDQPKTVANWIMGDLLGLLNSKVWTSKTHRSTPESIWPVC
jgi:aspartyl-tRNA(Asn)/glutamyl-tRNA(Gln) amidotransferase subunit B